MTTIIESQTIRKQQLAASEHTYPISEIFGPTIQGEGPLAGAHCYFVRFAGCDFDCSWCDTKYAVNPKYPGWSKIDMTAEQVALKLADLGASADDWVALSGGNPALFVNYPFVKTLTDRGLRLAMETQGSRVLKSSVQVLLDCLIVSPKPPSSGMANKIDFGVLHELLYYRTKMQITALKFVVFDDEDMDWAFDTYTRILSKGVSFMTSPYLSIGTQLRASDLRQAVVREQVLDDYQRVVERALKRARFKCFVILPQLHVLLWGQKRGV